MKTTRRVGNYRIVAPVGVGASSTVYRAVEDVTGYDVAIKVLAENLSLMPEARQRFIDEIEMLSSITSPAVARIFEVGETQDGQPYMVLELADRGDLRRRLEEVRAEGRTVEWSDVWSLGRHLHEALSSLHRAGIIHRDIAPGNILIQHRQELADWATSALLEPGERFLLADLGFAKGLEWASGLTSGGGTKGFASPEQLNDVTVVDHRTDIFSATAVLDWAVYDSPFAVDLEDFLVRGLSPEPADRFADMDEWYEAFASAMEAVPIDIPKGRAGRLIATLVVALALALLATTLWLYGLIDPLDLGQNSTASAPDAVAILGAAGSVTGVGGISIESPVGGSRIAGDRIDVAGLASDGGVGVGVTRVMLTICHQESDTFWISADAALSPEATAIPVAVTVSDSESTGVDPAESSYAWNYSLDLGRHPRGLYEIEAYAVLDDGRATEEMVVRFRKD